jgi:RHH-type proline utilization regulon transcriptional repressor/proline dehydrogenase/delta 1-pyrroline-5-carboxylate dehydrogenase
MRAENPDDAIDIVNSTGYGLTSGIETLDEREKIIWREKLQAGNLYINRVTTGAIVLRQPFGGMGKSAIGSGKKAGGLNYVSQLINIKHTKNPEHEKAQHPLIEKLISLNEDLHKETLNEITDILRNFAYSLEKEFLQEHDYFNIRGESNTIKYIKVQSVLLRFEESDSIMQMVASVLAVLMVGSKLHVSLPATDSKKLLLVHRVLSPLLNEDDSISQDDKNKLLSLMQDFKVIRYLNKKNIESDIYNFLSDKTLQISSDKFIPNGRFELLHYFIEQSISDSYHRYGNLGMKALSF